jgi:hypothetical protein
MLREILWTKQFGSLVQKCPTDMCTNTISPFFFDLCHDFAKSRGGALTQENCFIACHACNIRQGTKTKEEFGMSVQQIKKIINGKSVIIKYEEVDSDYTPSETESETD